MGLSIMVLLMTACSAERNYRGVSATKWQQLGPEEKQLIIDRSFADEVN